MKSQPINSCLYSDMTEIQLPQSLINEMMAENGVTRNPMASKPLFNFGIEYPKQEPMRERELSTIELLNMFDPKESLVMVYLPHFITQCIMYYLDMLVGYCKDNRLSEYKKHTRMLKALRDEYIEALKHEMPDKIFRKFLKQREEYLNLCGGNLTLMYYTFGNELCKKYGRQENEPVYCYANIMSAFVEFVEDSDREVNRRISEKMGKPCRNYGDARLTEIKFICKDIIGKYPIPKNQQTELCVNVMANKAKIMIARMEEEN